VKRALIALPAIIFAFWPYQAQAEPLPGLNAIGYTYQPTEIPTRSDDLYPTCGSEIENNINRNYNGEPFQSCGWDFFMIHYSGYITIPEHETIRFMVAADDGGTINIAGTEFGTWNLKGCSWSQQVALNVQPGSQPLDGWFFEWGGGACYMLAWNIDETGWAIVPDEAFTRNEVASPTTTTEPATTTTEAVTTTTEPVTTTTEQVTTTTEQVTTTTEEPVSTTTTTTTTTTVYVPTQTTTTTTEPEPTTTTTTEPEPETTTTSSPPEETTTTQAPDPVPVTTLPDELELPQSTTTEPAPTTTTLPEPVEEPQPEVEPQPETVLSEEQVDAAIETLLEDVADLPAEEVVAAVATVLAAQPTSEQATQLATSAEVLAVVTEEQAEAIFETISVEELTAADGEAIVDAVQDAPKKVRKAFESAINVFTGLFDSYVMIGSTIPVDERRTLVAVSSTLVAVGTSLRRRN
jgi:hypothetical protein